ncbi:hypothetical protein HAHE_25040 [Haloferula helveola]|uniref:Uncharacterized protein n=1 Tax=Haloferula helveola TaxID=490095 RepID=A0ABM7RAW9_9BACT|nr:hypothetical protein HAHE_25040 [Haloferula helveola]
MKKQRTEFKPEEVDGLVRDYAKPVPPAHRIALIERLRGERERFEANLREQSGQRPGRGGR